MKKIIKKLRDFYARMRENGIAGVFWTGMWLSLLTAAVLTAMMWGAPALCMAFLSGHLVLAGGILTAFACEAGGDDGWIDADVLAAWCGGIGVGNCIYLLLDWIISGIVG